MNTDAATARGDEAPDAQMRREAAEALDAAERQRDLVAMISHELRTPLAVMDGRARQIARLAEDPAAGPQIAERAQGIRVEVRRLIDLMDTVLAAARLEAGGIALAPTRTDLGQLVREVAEAAGEAYPGRVVSVDIGPCIDAAFLDPVLIRQVVANLASNACKYSNEGGRVTFSARREGDDVVVSVADTGVGIPPEEIEHLFSRYFRASTGAGRVGAGIGLHLVHEFVTMHGGCVEIESVVGVGSTFRVRLPADAP